MIAARGPIGAPPLRFLLVLLGGWAALRAGALMLWPDVPVPGPSGAVFAATEREASPMLADRSSIPDPATQPPALRTTPRRQLYFGALADAAGAFVAMPAPSTDLPLSPPSVRLSELPPSTSPTALAPPAALRWSASAWLLLRDDGGAPPLAPGGTLGGSQAGARLLYRLGGGLSLSGRAYVPLRRASGSEAALGVDWHPLPRLPVRLLAERRIALGRAGRDAFSLTLYGGDSVALPYGARLDAYAQAGIVGARSRDLFIDGAARVSAPLGPVEIGGGVWGAAQPGVSRIDIGPQLSWRLPVPRANLRVAADWRFRIAGEAAPGSGPALTLAADF